MGDEAPYDAAMTVPEAQHDRLTVVHIITSLDRGGAELLLLRLLTAQQDSGIQSSVIALAGSGGLRDQFEALGISVAELRLTRTIDIPNRMHRLTKLLRQSNPDVVQTWMYHSDLLGGLAARIARVPRVYWNIRHSYPLHPATRRSTRMIARINARLSNRLPTRIVCCASSAARLHAQIGYSSRKMLVIENGFDTERFRPIPAAAARLREANGLSRDTPIIGLVARFHEHKGHSVFVQAAQLLHQTHPETAFLLCGAGATAQNTTLTKLIKQAGLSGQFYLLGEQDNIEQVQAGLTIACSASLDEGFSNTLGEAMACGVPCVATDVGASSAIIGDTGWLVAPDDAAALAGAWAQALEEPRTAFEARCSAARDRIVQRYGISQMCRRYAQLFKHNNIDTFDTA